MSILTINKSRFAVKVSFTKDKMIVFLEDGREVSVPLEWFPMIAKCNNGAIKKVAVHRKWRRYSLGRNRRRHISRTTFGLNKLLLTQIALHKPQTLTANKHFEKTILKHS